MRESKKGKGERDWADTTEECCEGLQGRIQTAEKGQASAEETRAENSLEITNPQLLQPNSVICRILRVGKQRNSDCSDSSPVSCMYVFRLCMRPP